MFRTLAFIAMRQQADEAGHAQPLAFARRDELVEQNLRAIGEIAELAFPERQRVGLRERIAVFEAEHGLFREHRIDDLVMALALADMVQRHVARFVFLVDQHRMALREGAALAVLAGQADAIAVVDQRGEGQSLGGRPVDALAGFDRLAAIVEEALDRLVEVEALRNRAQLLAIFVQLAVLDGRSCRGGVLPASALGTDFRPAQRPSSQSALLGL